MKRFQDFVKAHPKITATIGTAVVAGATAYYGPAAGDVAVKVLPVICSTLGLC